MAGRGPGTTATASGPCSGGQSDPASEATRKPLKDAWDKNWTNLTQNGQSAQKGVIPDEVKSKMARMFKELEDYMDWSKATGRAPGACAGLNGGSKQGTYQMKNICKVLVQVVYWMGNLDKNENKSSNTVEQDWEKYLRCAIGNGIILRILLPKCKVEKFMEVISEVMRKGGSQNKASSVGSICDWVKMDDMREMEELIGDEVQQFLNKAKQDSGLGKIEGVNNVVAWFRCTDEEKTKEGNQEKTCSSDRIIDFLPAGLSKELNVLVDPLEKAKDCIQRNIDNNSNAASSGSVPSMGKLCNRLSCIETYLKTTARTAAAAAGTGKTTPTDALWNDVQTQVTELVTNISANGGENDDTDGLCNDITCPNGSADCVSKTACNIMVKALKEVHKNGDDDTSSGPLKLNNPIFRPTIRCVMLNAFAEKLKQHAQGGGYACAVEDGITKAFAAAKGGSKYKEWCRKDGKEDGPCEPCGKEHQVCTALKIGSTTLVSEVMKELDTNNTTNTPKMQQTLSEISNKVTLCDRMNCIIKQLKPANPSHTQNAGTISADQFWGEKGDVMKLWNELAQKMKDSNGNVTGSGCDSFGTDAERKACKYLHAGFIELKSIDTSNGTKYPTLSKKYPSFGQTMGCFLLHSYAKYMQKESTCNIENGIKKAFGSWNSTTNDKCTDGSPCIQCNWDDTDYDNCKINTNGGSGTTVQTAVKTKLEKFFNKDSDTNIKQMLTKINKMNGLCDHMKCIATHLNSPNGQQKSSNTSAKEFWEEDTGEVHKLWEVLSEAMKTNGGNDNGNGHCNQVGDDDRTPTDPEKKACNYLHAGLKYLKENSTSNANDNKILSKHTSLKQAMGCFLLKAYAKQMQKKSTCVIDTGIEKAFHSWSPNTKGTCNGTEPCVPCQWEDNEYDSCQVNTNGSTGTTTPTAVKPKVEDIVNNSEPDTESIITNINKMKDLCDGLQCIASHLNPSNGKQPSTTASTFWTEGGEVGQLWTELSEAMLQNVDKDNGGPCGTMDDGSATGSGAANGTRPATKPERKACNYLHAGLKKLKDLSVPTTSQTSNGKILSNPLLRQTVGCLLLKEYAKRMEGKSTCAIESGLQKAFAVGGKCTNNSGSCIECKWDENLEGCDVKVGNGTTKVQDKVDPILMSNEPSIKAVTEHMNERTTLCEQLQCAASNWFKNQINGSSNTGNTKKTWCDFWEKEGVKPTLKAMFEHIEQNGKDNPNGPCKDFGDGNEHSVERKACNHIAAGLKYIKDSTSNGSTTPKNGPGDHDKFFKQTMLCAALNLYATKIRDATEKICPIGEERIKKMFVDWNQQNNNSSSWTSCSSSVYGCFKCERNENFNDCHLSVSDALVDKTPNSGNCNSNNGRENVQTELNKFLNIEDNQTQSISEVKKTLSTINKMDDNFCTQVQCAIKKKLKNEGKFSKGKTPSWDALRDKIGNELTALLNNMNDATKQSDAAKYCNDANVPWNTKGHTERRTNSAACLHFSAGLQHIYGRPSGPKLGPVNGPSFEQTMGCLFLKEYAKQLQKVANEKKQGHSWVHPYCDIKAGIDQAFNKSKDIMEASPLCNKNGSTDSCFVCKIDQDYGTCSIGTDNVGSEVHKLFEDQQNKNQMEKTLENTVCPILITDLLTPFVPLAPVSIGLSAMAYYLWKYFGPLGKGGARLRRSPTEIPGPSVQEQVLDHVQPEAGPHEYQLVKERKPRSAPTRTKRSGRVNRRTIIEIHFEVLDECQKGDTQLNQKDFLELLVQEFMGSEFMEEEQVPKEDVLMEGVPLESVPMELVPSLGSGLMV
ncbi:SICAvar, type I [Plasmodium knowlesi strain H]|uniref:SICAvar, type I n=3 Tax=Plasmodium knowlesi TaxID=5850 RepID=A0A1A7VWX8_PLAKH|nr:SICAvar, type I [Plasmodium knowlesi strain H]OTN64279.1 SICAvar type I [Plasmodium knowlesi]CAA9991239.1 SICAvar, type I [Plasmodium knowlesi strain H]SBO26314.1 SICAvar, type I [Plasmodium knowlesi strain H]SBO29053.1 SICAvar, type I [Plasmodium knowlesi strain H]VVS80713.1 SICAvar, type I [Plasmodium knowlesi strain H]